MNADRRKRVAKVREELEALAGQIGEIEEEEQTAFDNLPEGLQDTERAGKMENAIDQLGDATGRVQEAMEILEEVSQ